MDDHMEIGKSGLIPVSKDWYYDTNRCVYLDEEGIARSHEEYENHYKKDKNEL